MSDIKAVDVCNDINLRWGLTAHTVKSYVINTKNVDFQDLMVDISKQRATSVESEVTPLSLRIRQRNSYLTELGDALANLSEIQAKFDSDSKGDSEKDGLTDDTIAILRALGFDDASFDKYKISKSLCEGTISRVKSEIDGLNNDSQTDMLRLQGLVDRRDESYSVATSLMNEISDTRSNLFRNL